MSIIDSTSYNGQKIDEPIAHALLQEVRREHVDFSSFTAGLIFIFHLKYADGRAARHQRGFLGTRHLISLDAVRSGQQAEVRFAGDVQETYPVQGVADELVVWKE